MCTNGVNGAVKGSETLQWKLGMVNQHGKYLTAEAFGFKINASGNTMRKKQLWTLEHDPTTDEVVYLKSHLGRYLSADKKGNVECCSETRGDNEKFTIVYESATNSDGHRWAVRSHTHNYYFSGSEDNLSCYEKIPEWWTIHLAVHPQVNMKSVNRKRYAHLERDNDQVQIDELIPWGSDALITLEFKDGRYGVKTCDNRYLHREGHLVDQLSADTLFTLEIKSGQYSGIALKDCTGRYLTAVGKGRMQCRNKTKGKDELFTLEDSNPQVYITAHNGKKVSTKQGVDLTANQEELTDKETFQLEYDKGARAWRVRTEANKYWSLESASGIQAVGNDRSGTGLFEIDWLENGYASIKASNGRYLTARMNGSLYAVSDSVTDKEKYFITIINRPILVLRCDHGFVGFKTTGSTRVECNRSNYDVIYMEGDNAKYFLKGPNGRYWSVDSDGTLNADSGDPQTFLLEFRGQSRFAIRAPNGLYIRGENNGTMAANAADLTRATLWEY